MTKVDFTNKEIEGFRNLIEYFKKFTTEGIKMSFNNIP